MTTRRLIHPPGLDSLASTILRERCIVKNPEVLTDLLGTLDGPHTRKAFPGRERLVLELHFGLGNSPQLTLEQVGRELGGVERERIRQIESRALRKLRHPSRSDLLRAVCEPDLRPSFKPSPVCPTCRGRKSKESKQCQACFSASHRITIVCPGCGKERIIPLDQERQLKSRLCRACYLVSRRETRPCIFCGEPITKARSQFRGRSTFHAKCRGIVKTPMNTFGVPTKVPGHPGYCLYEVDEGESVAIMFVGPRYSVQVKRVSAGDFLAGGMGYVAALSALWEQAQEGSIHLEEDSELEPPVLR